MSYQTPFPPQNPQGTPSNRNLVPVESRQRAALSYVLGLFSGVWFLLTYRRDPFIRFHALQSIGFSLGVLVILFVVRFGLMNPWVLGLISFLKLTGIVFALLMFGLMFGLLFFWIHLMWHAYSGERVKAPFVGHYIERRLGV